VILAGTALMVVGLTSADRHRALAAALRDHGAPATARVVGVGSSRTSTYLTVRYTAGPAVEQRTIAAKGAAAHHGDIVPVVYDPGHPERVLLATQLTGYGAGPTIDAGVLCGALLGGCGLVGLAAAAYRTRRTRARLATPGSNR
jgi:hypothetical protein